MIDNFFNHPCQNRKLFLSHVRINPTELYDGKALAYVSLTRFCPLKCKFCFSDSISVSSKKTTNDAFDNCGINKFIKFANKANLGYLAITGGGEPFVEYEKLLKIIKKVRVDEIVIITNGFWAMQKEETRKILTGLSAVSKNKKVVVRLSYDEFHLKALKKDVIYNILDYFENNKTNLYFKIRTVLGDNSVDKLLSKMSSSIIERRIDGYNISDSDILRKINAKEETVKFKSGFLLKIIYGRIFYPNTKINLGNSNIIRRNVGIFDEDMNLSEDNNFSTVLNSNGRVGFDFLINYNGNISVWGNEIPDNMFNLYHHDYNDIVGGTFNDPLSLAYLEKGSNYINKIVSEVNPKAVIRSKAVNIRNFANAVLFEEDKTRLYCTIRIVQDYLSEGRLSEKQIGAYPFIIKNTILMNFNELRKLYFSSKYNIVTQYKNNSKEDEFTLFLELIKNNHYDLSKKEIKDALDYYNKTYSKNISNIKDIITNTRIVHERRLMQQVVPQFNLASKLSLRKNNLFLLKGMR